MYHRILVATGGSPWSDAALTTAVALAACTGAALCVVTVFAFEMLPSIRRFHPVLPRDPKMIPSQCCCAAVSTIVRATSPGASTGVMR